MTEVLYGINKNKDVVSIYDIPTGQTGLACECVCPECGKPLLACALESTKMVRHFRHVDASGCIPEKVNETTVHFMAKKAIAEIDGFIVPSKRIFAEETAIGILPPYVLDAMGRDVYTIAEAQTIKFKKVKLEKTKSGVRPDAIVRTKEGDTLFVEFYCTHKVGIEKRDKIRKSGIATIEIDISKYKREPISYEELKRVLIEDVNNKQWIYFPECEKYLNDATAHYQRAIDVLTMKSLSKEEVESIKRGKKITEALIPENYKEAVLKLRDDDSFMNIVTETSFYKEKRGIPFFIDFPVAGEIAYKTDRRIWQGLIFDYFVYNANIKRHFSDSEIVEYLIKECKIPVEEDFSVKTAVNGRYMCWTKDAVNEFMYVLSWLGFIERQSYSGGFFYKTKQENSKTICSPLEEESELISNFYSTVDTNSVIAWKTLYNEMETIKAKIKHKKSSAERQDEMRRQRDFEESINVFNFDNSEEQFFDAKGYRIAKCIVCGGKVRMFSQSAGYNSENTNQCICIDCETPEFFKANPEFKCYHP